MKLQKEVTNKFFNLKQLKNNEIQMQAPQKFIVKLQHPRE